MSWTRENFRYEPTTKEVRGHGKNEYTSAQPNIFRYGHTGGWDLFIGDKDYFVAFDFNTQLGTWDVAVFDMRGDT